MWRGVGVILKPMLSMGVAMKCPKCGARVSSSDTYCKSCGTRLEGRTGTSGSSAAGAPSGSGGAHAPQKKAGESSSFDAVSLVFLLVLAVGGMWFLKIGPFAPAADDDAGASSEAVLVLDDDVPDEAFRTYLAENVDTDANGSLSREEADAVTALGTPGVDDGLAGLGISDLTGIDCFENLATLVCSNNSIADLDLSHNTSLEQVVCENSQVSELELPATDNLYLLHCTGNQIGQVDLSGCTGLTDVRLDGGTSIVGAAFDDAAAKTAIEDMALIYTVAVTPLATDPAPAGELMVTPGSNPTLDTSLVFDVVYPEVFFERENLSCTDTSYNLSYEIPDMGGSYFVPMDTVRTILCSFYGSCPDDLSYIGDNAVVRDGVGWIVMAASGPFMRTIESSAWASFGQIVSCEVTVHYSDGLSDSAAYRYRVLAVRDDESAFGYHLVSVNVLDGGGAQAGSADAAGTGAASAADATGNVADGSAGQAASDAGSSGDIDYQNYIYQELWRHGLVPDGSVIAYEETDEIIRAHVYEDHPDHVATLGWYTMVKSNFAITDDITGKSIYEGDLVL